MGAVVLFVAINLVAPLMVGELYPFTISPMFRDQPGEYCTYQLLDEAGNELELEKYGLHLIYDGNPPGLGMGIKAEPTLHRFGEVPELDVVVDRIRDLAAKSGDPKGMRLLQTVVRCNGTRPEAEIREAKISFDGSVGDNGSARDNGSPGDNLP